MGQRNRSIWNNETIHFTLFLTKGGVYTKADRAGVAGIKLNGANNVELVRQLLLNTGVDNTIIIDLHLNSGVGVATVLSTDIELVRRRLGHNINKSGDRDSGLNVVLQRGIELRELLVSTDTNEDGVVGLVGQSGGEVLDIELTGQVAVHSGTGRDALGTTPDRGAQRREASNIKVGGDGGHLVLVGDAQVARRGGGTLEVKLQARGKTGKRSLKLDLITASNLQLVNSKARRVGPLHGGLAGESIAVSGGGQGLHKTITNQRLLTWINKNDILTLTYHTERSSRLNLKAARGVEILREQVYKENKQLHKTRYSRWERSNVHLPLAFLSKSL